MTKSRPPTVYDVAKKAGVSIATVSRVLNTPDQVREDTRNRVMEAIDALEFVPKADASARARKQVGRIGILTPFFFTFPSFTQRMRGVATALANSSYELVIYPVDSLTRLNGYLSMLPVTRRLDGLIMMSLPVDDDAVQRLLASQLETVLIENTHPLLNSIQIDDRSGGQLAANYLLSKGHTRCAFLSFGDLPEYSIHPEDLRLSGFRQALSQKGVSLPAEYIQYSAISRHDSYGEISKLLDLPHPPTAIFAASDDLAIRVLRIARERRLQIPRDIAVIGFDDIEMADMLGLTTVRQSLDESGRMAAELLLSRIGDPARTVQHITLQLRVIERDTA